MTFISITLLFSVLFLAALIPSMSSITVFTRSISAGFGHGLLVSLGIVTGDICFILIAIFGISLFYSAFGDFIFILKIVSGFYIILLASLLWNKKTSPENSREINNNSLTSSYLTGLLITLSDQKAILFYLGLFPTLFDLSKISYLDIGLILAITVISVGSAKVCYAYLAERAWVLVKNPRVFARINLYSAVILFTVGGVVLLSAGKDVLQQSL